MTVDEAAQHVETLAKSFWRDNQALLSYMDKHGCFLEFVRHGNRILDTRVPILRMVANVELPSGWDWTIVECVGSPPRLVILSTRDP